MDFTKYQPTADKTANPSAYRRQQNRLDDQFMTDAIAEVGLADHPLGERAYDLAYRRGHSGGHSEIYSEMCYLAEILIRKD